jgi:muramidase (phage lysozyme)
MASTTDPPPLVDTLKDIGHTIQLAAIIPSTGHVRVQEVLNAIDKCVDETLRILRHTMMTVDSASDEGAGVVVGGQTFRLVAVGFSTFVMNLVAVDIYGKPVGDVATCSYACNREDVVDECERLRA